MARKKKQKDAPVEGEAPAAGGGRVNTILLVVVVLFAGAAAYGLFLKPTPAPAAAEDAAAAEPTPEASPEPVEGEVIDVATMTINLAGEDLRYARLGFAVVLESMADPAGVAGRFPLLKDAAITEVSTFTPDELRTSDGVARLRSTLSEEAVELFPDGEVLRVVLTELIVQ